MSLVAILAVFVRLGADRAAVDTGEFLKSVERGRRLGNGYAIVPDVGSFIGKLRASVIVAIVPMVFKIRRPRVAIVMIVGRCTGCKHRHTCGDKKY